MKISVVMATFNGQQYVAEQLDSIAAQTLLPDELLISDDCSEDDTIAVVEQWASSAPIPVRIHRNVERLGYSQNFGNVLGMAGGDYIFMCDQDDVWFPEKIYKMIERMEAPDRPLVLICDQLYADSDCVPTGETVLIRLRTSGFGGKGISGCATVLHRSFLPVVLPIPDQVAFDVWIHKVAQIIRRRAVYVEPLQLFRRHAESTRFPL